LEQEAIQAYYVLPPDYLQSRQMELYFTVRTLDGTREIGSGNIVNVILPFVAAFLFFFTVMTSAGYLLQVVSEEKENRTMEILITSLTPEQLIGGKAAGLMAVSLTQLGIWLLAIAIGVAVGAQFYEPLRMIRIPWTFVLVIGLYFLPAYALIAAMMTAIGGAATEMRQGQQIAGILNRLFILPMLLAALVFTNPDSPVLVFFTLFPTTSFVTVMLRWATSAIPVWQLAASWLLLVVSAGLGTWASARIFRAGMLHYGQSLNLRAALSAVRSRSS
jgi:ABC-2 type transport system permease protein